MKTPFLPSAMLVVLTGLASVTAVVAQGEATPRAERSRLPEPVVLADGLEVLHYWIAPRLPGSDAGYVQVYGEMVNTTGVELDAPTVGFRFYDAEGNLLGAVVTVPLFRILPPGKVMPFEGDKYDERLPLEDVDHVEVVLCQEWGETFYADRGDGFAGVEIVTQEVFHATDQILEIEGTVRNNGETPDDIIVRAAIYDEQGRYVGAYSGFTDAPVPPGKTGRFTLKDRQGFQTPPGPLDRLQGQDYTFDLWAISGAYTGGGLLSC